MKRSIGILFFLGASTLNLSSCGDSNKAESKIDSSLRPVLTENSVVSENKVAISTTALDKEFLLQGSLITQYGIPEFGGLQSRVVVFRKSGDQLAMLQSEEGISLSKDLESKYLITTFPIKSVTANEIIFDFNSGMSQLFVAGDWHAYDFEDLDISTSLNSVSTPISYLESVRYSKNNSLVINQVAQVNIPTRSGALNIPVQAIYYLSPYNQNSNFKTIKTANYQRMGFFEVAAQYVNGEPKIFASHRDNQKPFAYAISANTPAEYRQAIKDGILYWNKALGKNLIQVIDAPKNVTAPDPDYNIVQWVDWDDAGYAYADAQMDPRTGEVLHSQIFMTSAFSLRSKMKAKQSLANVFKAPVKKDKSTFTDAKAALKSLEASLKSQKAMPRIGLRNLIQNHLCYRDETENLQNAVLTLIANGATDEQALKISQDYIREVIAHEVGHTLGLRHNFAGSLGANFEIAARDNIFKNYLKNGIVDSKIRTTSSVMEYQLFEDSSISGNLIANGSTAFSYDQAAIDTLYNGKKFKNEEIPFFCTDSLLGLYSDCTAFDFGTSPLKFGISELNQSSEMAAKLLTSILVLVKTAPWAAEEDFRFEDLNFSSEKLAGFLNSPRVLVLKSLLYSVFPYLQIERQFRTVTEFNLEEFNNKSKNFVIDEIKRSNGLINALPNFDASTGAKIKERVLALISDPKGLEAFNKNGTEVVFTQSDKDNISTLLDRWLKDLDVNGVKEDLFYLDLGIGFNKELEGFDKLAIQKLSNYIVSDNGSFTEGELKSKSSFLITTKTKLSLPTFAYSLKARKAAIASFVKAAGVSSEAKDAIEAAASELRELAKKTFKGTDIDSINTTDLNEPALAWYKEVDELLAELVVPAPTLSFKF